MSEPRHILIVALRRSGTTAFWRLFRQDLRFRCFDEPFNMLLRELPAEHRKQVRKEFIDLYNEDPAGFRSMYAPIAPREEVTTTLTDKQKRYFRFLLAGGPTVIDVTRCSAKIASLHEVEPEAVFIHLYRSPISFVSSHLIPSSQRDFLNVRKTIRGRTLFTRNRGYNWWRLEELLSDHYDSTRTLLEASGIHVPPRGAPAVELLTAYWLGCYRMAEAKGKELYGDRFISMAFESFCESPDIHLRHCYALAGVNPYDLNTSALRAPGRGYRRSDSAWRTVAEKVGFSAQELARFYSQEK